MHSILRIKEKFKLFANDNEKKFSASLRKNLATKALRHEVEKKQSFFPLSLHVANINFCKKLFINL